METLYSMMILGLQAETIFEVSGIRIEKRKVAA